MTYRPNQPFPTTPTERLLIQTIRFALRLGDRIVIVARENQAHAYDRLSRIRELAWKRAGRIMERMER